MSKKQMLFIILMLFQEIIYGQEVNGLAGLIAPNSVLINIRNQFVFTEGPAPDKYGNIYFTDQPNDQIWKFDSEGNVTLFLQVTGRANGTFFDANGNLLTCSDEHNELRSVDMNKSSKILLSDANGKKMNGPNDLWISPKGHIYFTDPYYHRPYWNRPEEKPMIKPVYFLHANRKKLQSLDNSLVQPNGIVGTSDGKILYVSDIDGQITYKYSIKKNGKLTQKQVFANMGSDGMTLDAKGNLYLTGHGVTVFSPSGQLIGKINVPSPWVGNVCFGGKDFKTLFITASESIYTLRMAISGDGHQ